MDDQDRHRRALILAGGGMRVAWQAGAVKALAEEQLSFGHGDGTSGGIMNLAMLLSGLAPMEMCERWASVRVGDFVSLAPLPSYLAGPTNLEAMGDADGLVSKVFPHLGIDIERVRAATAMSGTFNVCDFATKTCLALPHTDVDVELLVAGVSLPLFMPPLRRGARVYTDAVWIKDANLLEAVRRGAEELWLLWCIGNTDRYGDGPLEQYVHMIEMSANGALFAELEQIAELNRRRAAGEAAWGGTAQVRVHVVKPAHPLPLDPELYLGRISGSTLVAMGYRDARSYLHSFNEDGVALGPSATVMQEPPLGVRFSERLAGDLGGRPLELELTVEVHDAARFAGDPSSGADVVGWARWGGWSEPVLFARGCFAVATPAGDPDTTVLQYQGWVRRDGGEQLVVVEKRLHDDPGLDLWADVTTGSVSLHEDGRASSGVVARGTVRSGAGDMRRLVTSIEPVGGHGLGDRASAVAAVGRLVLGRLWERYS